MKPASKKSPVEAQDFAVFKHPRALALSPDGKLLALTLAWCDLEKKKYFANLHVLEIAQRRAKQWTRGEHSDREPVWSPDGLKVAFLRHDQGLDRIFLISREGGEPEEVCKEWGGFTQPRWAGNDALIVKLRRADRDPEIDMALAEGKEPPTKAPAVRKITRLYYRLDGDGYFPQERWQLFRLDLSTRKLSQLTHSKADVGSFDVSADSEFCVYVANVHRDPDLHPYHQQLILLNLRTGRSCELPSPLGEKDAVAISPDGRRVVYLGHHNLNDAWGVEYIHPYLLNLETGRHRDLTPHFDRQANDQMLGDLGYGGGTPFLAWSSDGRKIYHQVTDEGDVYLARTGLGTGRSERVWKSKGHVALATANGQGLALLHLGHLNLGALYHCADSSSSVLSFEAVATFNSAYLNSHKLGKVREVHFKSGDGTRLHGWLVTPPDFRASKKYPAILEVHGGPRMQYGRTYFHEMRYLAAQGFVVFMSNPRGSQGYGKEFAGSTVASWGTDDFNDVMAAADWLEAQAFVDKKRIGITGGSYGGYMTALVVGRTHRFKAAVAQRGVMNLVTMQGTSDMGYDVRYEFGGYYWENPAGYEKMSPITYARHIRTPLLIMHNEADYRCLIEQAEQLFSTVKIAGKAPVEFWRFPEEPHGLSRGGRPDRRILRLQGVAGWFKRYLR